jgi:hypothetical protein
MRGGAEFETGGTWAPRKIPAMTFRAVAFLVLVYVVADFANPLMPGAVSFAPEASVDGVQPDRPRVDHAAPLATPTALPRLSEASSESPATVRAVFTSVPRRVIPFPIAAHAAPSESASTADPD